eukprot:g412.t1
MDEAGIQAALEDHAQFLGVDPRSEEDLMWLVKESLLAPVPPPWVQCETADGAPYYYNKDTNESSWQNPLDEMYKDRIAKMKKEIAEESSWKREEEHQGDVHVGNVQAKAAALPVPPSDLQATPHDGKKDEEEQEQEQEEDVVENIVNHRTNAGCLELKVHWRGSDNSEDEWFLRNDLYVEYPDIVAAYEAAKNLGEDGRSGDADSMEKAGVGAESVEYTSLRRTIAALESELDEVKPRLAAASDKLDTMERAKSRAERNVARMEDQVKSLRDELDSEMDRNLMLREQIQSMERELKRKVVKSQTASSDVPPGEVPNAQHIIVLEEKIKKLKAAVASKGEELAEKARKIEILETRIAEKDTADESPASPAPKESIVNDLKTEIQEWKNKMEKEKAAARAAKKAVKTMKGLLKEAQAELSNRSAQIDDVKAELKLAREEAADSKSIMEDELAKRTEYWEGEVKRRVAQAKDMAREELEEVRAALKEEIKERKRLHEQVMDLQGNIRVFCRVRPVNKVEMSSADDGAAQAIFPDAKEGMVAVRAVLPRGRDINSIYEYDAAFGPDSTQSAVFEKVRPYVTSALDGYDVCIFAYGQTGAGKTFTMEGLLEPEAQRGVNTRALAWMFEDGDARGRAMGMKYTFRMSMVEIYREDCFDLLGKNTTSSNEKIKLELRRAGNGKGVYAEGMQAIEVTSLNDVELVLKQGRKARAVGAHDFNEQSSRSHLVVTVNIAADFPNGKSRSSKIHMIDLAGSERISKTAATGERLKEAQAINKSLSALGDVISALGNGGGHVPFRNSKLTYLLSDSLSGNSKVLMVCCVSPTKHCASETVCSLGFAQRCRQTELGRAKKNASKGSGRGHAGGVGKGRGAR